ncbi:IS256 family transposase [Methylococcus sp. EFPC2]|uniref:IS256 family transposase n=1 Tax=Methylococcus sp. EFPC2 TaxID=2812648 RepID=UPI001968A097|nr:IS256 family transposase [Methylococcus sp. EFPC2]QSA99094.1 IS256 family transposase [Methylococcus sp. EFPC2]
MGDDKVIRLKSPGTPGAVHDVLTEVLREGAQRLLASAIEAEVAAFLERYRDEKTAEGLNRMVRNGRLPGRTIQTGIGDVEVSVPRVRDREGKVRFSSSILPPYLRRTKTLEELLPWLYLKGVSTGDFQEALTVLLGNEAPGLSASTISRLKEGWKDEHQRWSRRDLSNRRYVYLWVGGIHFGVRLEDAAQCILVVMGATAEGKKELVALADGYRESEQSWRELLLGLKSRGLKVDPQVAVGDGALGFWKALPQVFGTTRTQRCWVHKTANILNKLPKSQQPKAKAALHEIWMAATREDAEKAFEHFLTVYRPKYPQAAQCLEKDRNELLAFYDFPAEHWIHLRTTNPIESTFATVRLRTAKTRGCVSRESILAMVFMLVKSAERHWRKLNGIPRLAQVIQGVVFKDGVREDVEKIAA